MVRAVDWDFRLESQLRRLIEAAQNFRNEQNNDTWARLGDECEWADDLLDDLAAEAKERRDG